MTALIFACHNNETLDKSVYAVATAAREAAAPDQKIDILVAGHKCREVARQAACIPEIRTVYLAEGDELEHLSAEECAVTLDRFLQQNRGVYEQIMTTDNSFGKNIIPRAAALLGLHPLTGITRIVDGRTFERPVYAGNALARVKVHGQDPVLMTIRTTAFDTTEPLADPPSDLSSLIQGIKLDITGRRARFISRRKSESERPDLTSAKIVVGGGRGLGSKENFRLVEELADALGGAVGASRAAVDAGFISNDHQIGQTGKIIAPELYVAAGISGAVQHLAGIKDAKIIVALNKDEKAPIFKIADYGIIGDVFDILPELTRKLTH